MNKHALDITSDVCPLTFVKTKLLIERMAPGDVAVIRIRGAEPLENVPRSVREHGHEVVSLAPADPSAISPEDIHILILRKAPDQDSSNTA